MGRSSKAPVEGKEPRQGGFKKKKEEAPVSDKPTIRYLPDIKNKIKKFQKYQDLKFAHTVAKQKLRKERQRDRAETGEEAPKAITIESKRVRGDEFFEVDDVELKVEEANDEFTAHFEGGTQTKVVITTTRQPTVQTKAFAKELVHLFPNAEFRTRRNYTVKEITGFCTARNYSDLIVIGEQNRKPYSLLLIHLPEGPTAYFRVSNPILHHELTDAGDRTTHIPELHLKNFDTRLGRRVGRMLSAVFPTQPQLKGRSVVTFHNQRDFIFVRFHRYIFDSMEAVRIQQMGPEFTLRLKSLQKGTFNKKFAEYEYKTVQKEVKSRTKFQL